MDNEHNIPKTPEEIQAERREILARLTAEAYADGLYNDTAEDYREALKKARKKIQTQLKQSR